MNKNSLAMRNLGSCASPESPEFCDNKGGIPEGRTSDRVPLPTSSICRQISTPALMPLGIGKALPSKWDDAERWITSPVSGYGVCRTKIMQPKRQLESNSAPLGAPGLVNLDYSPTLPALKGKGARNLIAGSPLVNGVLVPNGLSIHYGDCIPPKPNPVYSVNSIARSISLPGFSNMQSDSLLSSSQDDIIDDNEEAETIVSRAVSRRDMATQMSPGESTLSSPRRNLSFSVFPSSVSASLQHHGNHFAKDGVRDVQVDGATTTAGQPKKRKMKRGSLNIKNLHWLQDVSEESRMQREEAKITAWENLQKAKAEAAIQRLEMELERKRAATIDKILNKLDSAQMKAQAMRDSISKNYTQQSQRSSHSVVFFWKSFKRASLSNCILCHRN